jgi:hypothetical protein
MRNSRGKPEASAQLSEEQLTNIEQTAHKVHRMADQLHKKPEQIHIDAIAARQRAQTPESAPKPFPQPERKPRN